MSDADRREGGRPGASRGRAGGKRRPQAPETLDERRYYRIGDVSRVTGVKPHVLRYWESEFRWMAPAKSRSKQRLYRKRDIEMIALIRRLLYEERYTIAGARRRLRELGVARALDADDAIDAAPEAAPAGRPGAAEGTAQPGAAQAAAPPGVPPADGPAARERAATRDALRRIRQELVALRAAL